MEVIAGQIRAAQRTSNFKYAIRGLVSAAEELRNAGREIVWLNIGDPQAFGFRPPEHVIEAVQHALRDRFTGYASSAGLVEARAAIANYASGLGAPTRMEDVVVTSGASEAAELVLTALVDTGDEVLIPAPGYPLYSAILEKLGARAIYYHLNAQDGWRPDIAALEALVGPRTRALLLINPNNPTGSITPDEATKSLLELAVRRGLLVISDEVYRELCYGEPPTAASVLAQETGAPVITLESLSKTHMVPGWRAGWMRFTNCEKMADLIVAITRLASGRLCSPTPTQYAIKPALEGPFDYLQQFIREMRLRRDAAVSGVTAIDGLSCFTPEAAFYLMIKADDPIGGTDESFVRGLLEATGILMVPGSGFGTDPRDGYFRMVYLADEDTIGRACAGIEQFMVQARTR